MYDIAIVGAGINGSCVAHELNKAGKKVIMFDETGVASGGSGAAGAFISPKFSKTGELKELLHDSFLYSMAFYETNFPKLFNKTKLLHIAQDSEMSLMLKELKKSSSLALETPSKEVLDTLTPDALKEENISLYAGIVNAAPMCQALSKNAKIMQQKVESLVYDDGLWVINETYSAKEVVLATGAYESLIKEPYIKVRGIWGHRIDIKTSTQNSYSIHQNVSISPNVDGVLAIGATHNVHYHPQTATEPYDVEAGREELLAKASKTIELKDVEVVKDYTGLRSGTVDYMPLLGGLVISKETFRIPKIRFDVKKADYSEYVYYSNLYVINGSGGYGFVLAPYLAKLLSEHILSAKKISDRFSPARFFHRWAKRL